LIPASPLTVAGLGILAGDTIKSCADLKIPLLQLHFYMKKVILSRLIHKGTAGVSASMESKRFSETAAP